MRVGIVGAGGIGSYYAGLLARAGVDVRLIARGEHLAAIRWNGLKLVIPNEQFIIPLDATDDESVLMGCDYVIVAVKGYSLSEVGHGVANAAGAGAAVVPLLNGVDAAERLSKLGVPRTSIIGGLVRASLVRTAPGVVERKTQSDRVTLGELDRVRRDRTATLAAAFGAAGVVTDVSDDMPLDLWRKFAFIVTMGVVCGLARQPIGPIVASERGKDFITRTLREVVRVSGPSGVALSDADEAAVREQLFALAPATTPSFLLDLERGGPTELDMLMGSVCRFGDAAGIDTPVHDVAVAAFEAATRSASPAH